MILIKIYSIYFIALDVVLKPGSPESSIKISCLLTITPLIFDSKLKSYYVKNFNPPPLPPLSSHQKIIKSLSFSYATYAVPVPLSIVVHIGERAIEVEVIRVGRIVGRRRPIVAEGAAIAERAIEVVASVNSNERRSRESGASSVSVFKSS